MRCAICTGHGWVRNEMSTARTLPAVPCPHCGGSGWDHCCEGSDASCEVIAREPRPLAHPFRQPDPRERPTAA